MNLFNKKAKTEMEKNQEELSIIAGSIAELDSHMNDLNVIKKGLELELKLGSDAQLEKRFKKISLAFEKSENDLRELKDRQNKVQQAIAEEKAQERAKKIEEAGKVFEERVYVKHKRTLMNSELRHLESWLYTRTGNPNSPHELHKLAGISPNKFDSRFDHSNPEHAQFIEQDQKASKKGTERAEKEFEELLVKINAFLGRNE